MYAVGIRVLSGGLILKKGIKKIPADIWVSVQIEWPCWEDDIDRIHVLFIGESR